MKKMLAAVVCAVVLSGVAFAEGTHPPKEYFKGAGFDLVKVNDVLVGTYDLIPIWADKVCGDHIKGLYKKDTEIKEFSVMMKDKKLTGTFGANEFVFAGLDKEKKEITLRSGVNTMVVNYDYEKDGGEHLVNITFRFRGLDNKDNVIKLEGECCLGSIIYYSLFLVGVTSL